MEPPPGVTRPRNGPDAIRGHNLQLVARYVREQQPTTRRHISTALGFNKATVSSLVAELIDLGLLQDDGAMPEQRPGRPANVLRVDRRVHAGLVVEILADEVVVGVWTLALEQLSRRALGIEPRELGPKATLRRIARALEGVLIAAGPQVRWAGLLVALPGLLNTHTGLLEASEPLGWGRVQVDEALRSVTALATVPIRIARIANLATIAELGNPPLARDAICLHAGDTGIGAGIVTGGELLLGSRGRAGELRFVDLAAERPSGDGWPGIVPVRDSSSPRAAQVDSLLAGLSETGSGRHGALDSLARVLASWLAALVALLDPKVVVLAGQLAALHTDLEPQLRMLMAQALTPRAIDDIAIVPGRHGKDAVQVGGAILLADATFASVLAHRSPGDPVAGSLD